MYPKSDLRRDFARCRVYFAGNSHCPRQTHAFSDCACCQRTWAVARFKIKVAGFHRGRTWRGENLRIRNKRVSRSCFERRTDDTIHAHICQDLVDVGTRRLLRLVPTQRKQRCEGHPAGHMHSDYGAQGSGRIVGASTWLTRPESRSAYQCGNPSVSCSAVSQLHNSHPVMP